MAHWGSQLSTSTRNPVEEEEDVSTESLAEYRYMGRPTIDQDLRDIENFPVPARDRARAQHLADNREFRGWLPGQVSGHRLINGDYSRSSQVSGLSIFCNSLRRALQWSQPRCIPLIFFCGLHTGPPARPPSYADTQRLPAYDDVQLAAAAASRRARLGYDEHPPPPYAPEVMQSRQSGGVTLIRSLIYQLLRSLRGLTIPMTGAALQGIESGDVTSLCELFSRLLLLLSPDVTVWCLVDGVEHYEQDGYWGDASAVLEELMRVSEHGVPNDGAAVRLLLTTPTDSTRVQDWFSVFSSFWLAETGWEHIDADSRSLEDTLETTFHLARRHVRAPPRENHGHVSRRR